MNLTKQQLADMIDHTLLKQYISNAEMAKHCEEARQYGFHTVAINNALVRYAAQQLKGSGVLCDAAVSFPLGQSTIATKVYETEDVILEGAGEVDYVVNLVEVKNKNWDYIRREMQGIVEVCNKYQAVSKVIFETCYLTEEEKIMLCSIAKEVRPTFVKTSTGFGAGGARVEDVRLMRQHVGDAVQIKAAGGVRSAKEALDMIAAGATRIGTSCGIAILEDYARMMERGEL